MSDIVGRLRTLVHLTSAAIAPQTSPEIEAMRGAADEIERLRAALIEAQVCIVNYSDPKHPEKCVSALVKISTALNGTEQLSARTNR